VNDYWKLDYTVSGMAHAQGVPVKPSLIAPIERRHDAIVEKGLAFHSVQPALAKASRRGLTPRWVGHNFLLRLSTRKQHALRFFTE
jgi:hypothetical protein